MIENRIEDKYPRQDYEEKSIPSGTLENKQMSPLQAKQESSKVADSQKEVQIHNSSLRVYLYCLFVALGSFYVGYPLGMLNLALGRLNQVYGVDDNKALYEGLLQSAVGIGATFGCLLAGSLMKKFGERKCCIFYDIFGIIISLIFIIPEYYAALVARFLMGLNLGLNSTVVLPFLRQISPPSLFGKTGAFHQVFLSLGIFISYAVGMGFPLGEQDLKDSGDVYWRFVLMFPLITCLIRLIALLAVYRDDTPSFLISQKNFVKAKEIIAKIYKPEYAEQQYNEVVKEVELMQKQKDTWGFVFSQGNRKKVFVGTTLSFLLQYSGITAVTFYSSTIFKESTGSQQSANNLTLISGALLFAIGFVSGELGKHFGRKPIILIGNISMMITNLVFGILSLVSKDEDNVSDGVSGFTIALIFIYLVQFNLAHGTFVWIYNADILFGKSLAIATSMNWFAGFIQALIFPQISVNIGTYAMFFLFVIILFFGNIFIHFMVPETKGLTRDQIQAAYDGKKSTQQAVELQTKNSQEAYDNITTQTKLQPPTQTTFPIIPAETLPEIQKQ